MNWIKPLSEITLVDMPLVGAKAAHLGAMLQAGFSVPPGFVVTVDAFAAHLGRVSLHGNSTAPERPAPPRLAAELIAELGRAVDQELSGVNLLAVRSSASEEDGTALSFAGQHATYYFVTRDTLDQAIVDCWMSLWSEEATAYRNNPQYLVDDSEARMAVIVQELVSADRSGVCFSRDPTGANINDMLIEATWGLGAALVDGRVTPDHYVIDTDGDLVRSRISDKRVRVRAYTPVHPPTAQSPDPETADGARGSGPEKAGARLEPVPAARAREAVLTAQEIRDIGQITGQLEALFDGPQDVEWAYAGDKLYLLQSRPITVLLNQLPDSERPLVIFKPLAENFSEPLTPLAVDLYQSVLPDIGEFVHGRYYLDLDMVDSLLPWQMEQAELVDLALLRRIPKSLSTNGIRAKRLFKLLRLATIGFLGGGAFILRSGHLEPDALEVFARHCQVVERNTAIDPPEALHTLFVGRHAFEPIGHYMYWLNIAAGRYWFLLDILRALLARWVPDFDTNLIPFLCHGELPTRSQDMVERVSELAQIARNDAAVVAILQDSPSGGLAEFAVLETGSPFVEKLNQFLAEYGHRATRELDIAAPRWGEDPGAVLAMIAAQLHHTANNSTPLRDRRGTHLVARDKMNQALKPWQRRIIGHVINRTRYFMGLREDTRHFHTMAFTAVRNKVRRIEHELLMAGKLRCRDDIFFLKWLEIDGLLRGTLTAATLKNTIRQRRREWSAQARMRPLDTINVIADDFQSLDTPEGAFRTTSAAPSDTQVLNGTCACPGEVTGVARVILSPTASASLGPEDILVAPYTDPSWTPLFPAVAGIVVGVGSFLSHAGTVAREYQIPCIVDVTNCTQRIRNGQRLKVNATKGTVEILP